MKEGKKNPKQRDKIHYIRRLSIWERMHKTKQRLIFVAQYPMHTTTEPKNMVVILMQPKR